MSDRVWIRRAYDEPTHNDGYRVLVDRLWPRLIRIWPLYADYYRHTKERHVFVLTPRSAVEDSG